MGRRLAVGDHDDLLRPGPVGQHAPAQKQAVLHVGAVDEVPRHLGELLGLDLARHLGEADQPQEVAGKRVEMRVWRAMATFLAARKLSRIGIDSDRSTMRTVEARVRCSVREISKSSGERWTGVPVPERRTALCTVRWMSRVKGSPNS